jgi:hypothetical protein
MSFPLLSLPSPCISLVLVHLSGKDLSAFNKTFSQAPNLAQQAYETQACLHLQEVLMIQRAWRRRLFRHCIANAKQMRHEWIPKFFFSRLVQSQEIVSLKSLWDEMIGREAYVQEILAFHSEHVVILKQCLERCRKSPYQVLFPICFEYTQKLGQIWIKLSSHYVSESGDFIKQSFADYFDNPNRNLALLERHLLDSPFTVEMHLGFGSCYWPEVTLFFEDHQKSLRPGHLDLQPGLGDKIEQEIQRARLEWRKAEFKHGGMFFD